MLYSLWKYKLLLFLIILFFVCSIICQIVPGVILSRLLEETENMAATKNRPLKQCRLKYINCCQLNGRVVNTGVFVDRFIRKLTFSGISLNRISNMAGQMMMLSILVTGICVCRCLSAGGTLFQIIPYYVISILELYLYFTLSGAVDIAGRKEALKIELTDYLENHVAERLEHGMAQKEKLLRELEQVRSSRRQSDMEDRQEDEQKEQPHTKPEPIFSPDEALELEELLKSLMV